MKALSSRGLSWQKRVARWYASYRLKRSFSDIRILEAKTLKTLMNQGPLIIASNHVAYWDAFLLVALEAHFQAHAHCLMDARNLKQFAFFRQLGALPLDRQNAKQGFRDMRRSLSKLKAPGDLLFIFPSGQQQPAHWPLRFQQGVAYLAETSKLPVVPLGLRYDYREGPRPGIHLAFGKAHSFTSQDSRKQFTQSIESSVAQCFARIDDTLSQTAPQGESLLGRKHRIDEDERRPFLAQTLNRLSGGKQ